MPDDPSSPSSAREAPTRPFMPEQEGGPWLSASCLLMKKRNNRHCPHPTQGAIPDARPRPSI
ncbi:hypothetical protein LY78DRAFT_651748 [Colletotrichum sublineola]|nr:hypothetical protein LY78DRAFT_651748 [Colletotrichum sublineola]